MHFIDKKFDLSLQAILRFQPQTWIHSLAGIILPDVVSRAIVASKPCREFVRLFTFPAFALDGWRARD